MDDIIFKPIGIIHTSFTRQEGTPIQSKMSLGNRGTVEILPQYKEGLKDLDGFDRVYLIYQFNGIKEGKLTVTPYLDDQPRGIFATRSPCRPNPIGISCVRLLSVKDGILEVEDVDMLDGTPLIDIKPYNPRFDHFEIQRAGWFDNAAFRRDKADARFEKKHESIS